ncbi:MAG: TetR/AcrR family transcriptional regulator, partial [Anaerolineae bacterium]|nr:TetR/AcrR family transcriptional regulator [Anaerolineae bacterium]
MARKPADQSVSREDILQAAAEVLRRNGYETTTMKDIAAQVKLTAASLYHHFENKDTLLLAVLELGLDYVSKEIESVLNSDLGWDAKLREMIRVQVTKLTENRPVGAALVMEVRPMAVNGSTRSTLSAASARQYEARRAAFFEARRRFENLFHTVLRDGIAAGAFRAVDVPVTVKGILGANNWVAVWYRDGGRLTGEQIADQIA